MILLAAFAFADDTLLLGPGPEETSLADLIRGGAVRGRSGALVGQLRPGRSMPGMAGVSSVEALADGVVRLRLERGVDDLELARRLHDDPAFAWIHPDLVLNLIPSRVPDDPLFPDEWHLDNTGQGGRTGGVDINAPMAWDIATGAGVTIAVLDSGVQLDHPDLVVRSGRDYIDGDDDASPSTDSASPHGTGVAGIAAARGNNGYGVAGVAWEADLYAIRLIGGNTTTSDLYDAFTEAVDAGAGVLNNSWGFGGCGQAGDSGIFTQMFKYAERKGRGGLGSVVVFAAGNDGCDNSEDPMLSNDAAVVVAALEWWDQRASYSNWGDDIRIAAPTSILTTDITPGGYGSYAGDDAIADGFSGTSGASPVVAGVVALMLEANPRASAEQVRDVLCQTAQRNDLAGADWDESGWSPYYGCGAIDAGAAVATIANTAPPAPVPRLVREVVFPQHILIAWEPAVDPDGDVHGYTVQTWLDGDDDAAVTTTVMGEALDLSEQFEVGSEVTWRVAALDPWGAGEWSVETTFSVEEPPSDNTGDAEEVEAQPAAACATGGSPPSTLAGLLLVGVVMRRRER